MPLLNVYDWSWRVYERFFYTAIKGIKLEGRGFDWFVERKKTLSRPHAFFENKWTRNQLMNFFSKLKFLPLSTKEKPTHTVEKLLGRSFFTHFSGNLWLISEHIIDIPEDGLVVFLKPSNRQPCIAFILLFWLLYHWIRLLKPFSKLTIQVKIREKTSELWWLNES